MVGSGIPPRKRIVAAARAGPRVLAAGAEHDDGLANFVPLSSVEGGLGEDARFGPDAVLLTGFTAAEAGQVRALLDEMGAEFVRTVVVDKELFSATLEIALQVVQNTPVTPLAGVPRMMLLSGMSSEEVLTVIDEYRETGLPDAMFAAAVPKSIHKTVSELVEEISGDHKALTGGSA